MIYLVACLAGFVNGIFASGAGQIIVFYLVFVQKYESHKSRGVSILILSLSSIVSLGFYFVRNKVEINVTKIVILAIISIIIGVISSKIMSKIKSNYLNLISGILMTILAIVNLIRG